MTRPAQAAAVPDLLIENGPTDAPSRRRFRGAARLGRSLAPALLGMAVYASLTVPWVGHRSLWLDEAATWDRATSTWGDLAHGLWRQDLVFAGYYAFMHVWTTFGDSETWLRLPSILAGIGTVGATALLAQYLWRSRLAGAIAGIVVASHPSFLGISLQARPYSLAAFAAVCATAAFSVALRRPGRRYWMVYALLVAAMIYIHLFAVLLLPAHVVTMLVSRRLSVRAVCSMGTGCLLAAPMALSIFQRDQVSWIPGLDLRGAVDAVWFLIPTRASVFLLALAVVLALVARDGDGRFAGTLVLAWAALPTAILICVSLVRPWYVDRYVTFSLPASGLVVAGGLATLTNRLRRSWHPRRLGPSIPWVVLVTAFTAYVIPAVHETQRAGPIDDYRTLSSDIAGPGFDRILVPASPDFSASGVAYYLRHSPSGRAWRAASRQHTEVSVSGTTTAAVQCGRVAMILRGSTPDIRERGARWGCRAGQVRNYGGVQLLIFRPM